MSYVISAAGRGAYLASGLPASAGQTAAFTVAAWTKIVTDRVGQWRYHIELGSALTNAPQYINAGWRADGSGLTYEANSSFYDPLNPGNPPVDASWFYHYLRCDGAGSLEEGWWDSANGVWVQGTTTIGGDISLACLTFGSDSYSEWINGKMQGGRMWSAYLSDAQLEAEKDATAAVTTAGLVIDAPLDTDGTDASGNGNDLTIASGTFDPADSAPPWNAPSGTDVSIGTATETETAKPIGVTLGTTAVHVEFGQQGDADSTYDLSGDGTGPWALVNAPASMSVSGSTLTFSHATPVHERAVLEDSTGQRVAVWHSTRPSTAPQYPLSVSGDRRYITDAGGHCSAWNGDAAWSAAVNLSQAGMTTYLADRAGRGVNAIYVNAIEHAFSDQSPRYLNKNGDAPFTTMTDWTAPNEPYWQLVDWLVREAHRYGITVMLFPAYVGYGMGSEGWAAEMDAAAAADFTTYGDFLGSRYASYPNVAWAMGGDSPPTGTYDLTTKINNLATAIKAAAPDHLITAHSQRGSSSIDSYNETWLDLNATYASLSTVAAETATSWAQDPTGAATAMPTFLIESTYGNEANSAPEDIPKQALETLMQGACGHFAGSDPTWYFGVDASSPANSFADTGGLDWHNTLDQFGAQYFQTIADLIDARDIPTLTPDHAHAVVTAGGTWWARASAQVLVAYTTTATDLTIDRTALSAGTYNVNWYSPTTGTVTSEAPQTMGSGSVALTPPDANGWILLVDDQALGLSVPGATPVEASIAPAYETEAARVIVARTPTTVPIGTATETELARAVTASTAVSAAIGQAVETEIARVVSAGSAINVLIGQAVETETAAPMTVRIPLSVSIGQAVELEQARAVVAGVDRSAALRTAIETEVARSITPQIIGPINVPIGRATETEHARAFQIDVVRVILAGLTIEPALGATFSVGAQLEITLSLQPHKGE